MVPSTQRLCSLALRCDPIGFDDTDSGALVGVSVFTADKADGEAGSVIQAENTYLGTQRERCAKAEPYRAHRTARVLWSQSTHVCSSA